MAAVKELIRTEADQTLSFGDYELSQKTKLSDYEFEGDLYKIKTFSEITKLEKNGMFIYESVPGTAVYHFKATEDGVSFQVEGKEDAQITLDMKEDTEYNIYINGEIADTIMTNSAGKLTLSVESIDDRPVDVKIVK